MGFGYGRGGIQALPSHMNDTLQTLPFGGFRLSRKGVSVASHDAIFRALLVYPPSIEYQRQVLQTRIPCADKITVSWQL